MKQKIRFIAMACAVIITIQACRDTWLDARPDKKLVVPETLQDLRALLDYTTVMNDRIVPGIGEIGSDDLYLVYDDWQSVFSLSERNAYIWSRDLAYDETGLIDWDWPYRQVYYTNVALEGLDNISPGPQEQNRWNHIKGSALFYRSWAFYQLAQLFCDPYDKNSASGKPGVPLKLESDINGEVRRATIGETYDRIINDLKVSLRLLPASPLVKTRPGKPAAYGLLAKAYLQTENYSQAQLYADSCLQLHDELVDYNTLDLSMDFPFEQFNEEVIFHATMTSRASLLTRRLRVDTVLLGKYTDDDLRKEAFFTETADSSGMTYRGSYDGSQYFFAGIATDEVLLIRAECFARNGDPAEAVHDLNTLLAHRFREGTFTPLPAGAGEDVLETVLKERRKELLFRGIRWPDLRRLNKDPRFEKTLLRQLNGETYRLEPEDKRYTLGIPENVMIWNEDMEQNIR